MSAYLSYMKAFGTDLRQVAVWEPGTKIGLGDYGEIRNHRWERLGSIWELLTNPSDDLREYLTSSLDRLSLGSAEVISTNAGVGYGAAVGSLSLSIRFNKENSVFVRADKCETRALKRVQAIAENLAVSGVWQKGWSFANEIRSARRFLVLLGSSGGGQVQVTAKTNELLEAFVAGQVTADAGIQISGSEVLQFVGRSGPIHMSLTKVTSPWLLQKQTKAARVEFAESKSGSKPVFIENIDVQDIIGKLSHPHE